MNTIQPYSTRNNIYFCQQNKRSEQVKPQENITISKTNLEKAKDISFIKGIICATTILLGVNTCQNSDREFLLEQLAVDVEHFNSGKRELKVKDATDDKVLDIVIEDECGSQSIYDIKNNHLYYKDKHEFEKIY